MGRREQFTVGELTVTGNEIKQGAEVIYVAGKDASGNITLASGLTKPTDGTAGYAKSCLFIKTDAGAGTAGLYENIGLTTSCSFNLIGAIAAGEITLATGSILVGAAGVAAALDAKTDKQILIGNATTLTSVPVSGDVTISNLGAVTIGAKKVVNTMIAAAPGTVLVGTKTSLDVTAVDNSAAGAVVIGQGAGETCVPHALSGDVTMAISGATTIGADKVAHAMLKDDAVETHNIKDANVTAGKLAPGVFTNTFATRFVNPTLSVDNRITTVANMKATAYTIANASNADGIPRNVIVTHATGGGVADTFTNLVVTGTNYSDAVITESIPISADGVAVGTKAFKTITEVITADWVVDAAPSTPDTIKIGFGNLLGMSFVKNVAGAFVAAGLGTGLIMAPTITVGATIELMTVDLSTGTYDAAKDGFVLFSA